MMTPELPKEPVGSDAETLLEFPCDFPLKIMGLAQDNLAQEILGVIHQFAPDYNGKNMEMRASSSGKYVSLTCTVNAQSKAQLDDLYRALTSHPLVKVVL
jgi:putative lipoic acid-binding regulatory protein